MATHKITTGRVRSKRVRQMTLTLALVLVCAMVLPLTGYLFPETQSVTAQAQQAAGDANQRSEFWRVVREGGTGYSSITGSAVNPETNTLYNITGQNWRQIRNGLIANYGGWFLFAVVIAIVLFYALRGRIDLTEPESGERVQRWGFWERSLHWYTASLFIALTVTGLSLLFGRALLIPLLGPEGFSFWAGLSINIHNTLGPFFVLGPILMFIFWVRHNLPTAVDVAWFFKGGGIIGKVHPSAGKANGGEKVWFWIVILLGVGAVSFSGFALIGWVQEYFGVEFTRSYAQYMHILHSVSALLWIAVFFGHVYIGTIGSEGSLDAMTKGHVSKEWAKQHHDLWYDEVKNADSSASPASSSETESTA